MSNQNRSDEQIIFIPVVRATCLTCRFGGRNSADAASIIFAYVCMAYYPNCSTLQQNHVVPTDEGNPNHPIPGDPSDLPKMILTCSHGVHQNWGINLLLLFFKVCLWARLWHAPKKHKRKSCENLRKWNLLSIFWGFSYQQLSQPWRRQNLRTVRSGSINTRLHVHTQLKIIALEQ